MLKRFIACTNMKERFHFFDNTKVSDWTEPELESIADIIGVKLEAGSDVAQKYMKLSYELSRKANTAV